MPAGRPRHRHGAGRLPSIQRDRVVLPHVYPGSKIRLRRGKLGSFCAPAGVLGRRPPHADPPARPGRVPPAPAGPPAMAPDPRDRAHEPGLRRLCVLQLLDRGGPTDREELLDQARLGAARAGDIERACGRRRRRGESNRIRAAGGDRGGESPDPRVVLGRPHGGGQSVPHGVHARARLAGGGARPGALPRVPPVGFDLPGRGHASPHAPPAERRLRRLEEQSGPRWKGISSRILDNLINPHRFMRPGRAVRVHPGPPQGIMRWTCYFDNCRIIK